MNLIVECGAVPALVMHLQSPPYSEDEDCVSRPLEHEVEKGSALALGLLSVKVNFIILFLILGIYIEYLQ